MEPYAYSADSVFRTRKYSRVASRIDFTDIATLRAGFANRRELNWFDKDSDVTRQHIPFFVMYALSRASAGGALCWRGRIFWEEANGSFTEQRAAQERCRGILDQDVGRRVFGIDVDRNDELAMRLEPTSRVRIAGAIALALSIAGVIVVLLLCVRPDVSRLAVSLAVVGAAAIAAGPESRPFARYEVLQGGSDGIAYESAAHVILQSLERGDLAEALRGDESVFYFMPGLRYFRALEKVVFGDTSLGYLAVVLVCPLVLFALLRLVVPLPVAVLLLLLYFSPQFASARAFAWHLGPYLSLARNGLAEPLGYVLFAAGCVLVLTTDGEPEAAARSAFGAGVLTALGVMTRPNLVLAAALLLSCLAIRCLKRRSWNALFLLCLGFLPFFWMPIHNFVYGRQLVLMSSAGPLTLITPPVVYLQAAAEVWSTGRLGDSARRVATHAGQWIGTWYQGLALLACLFGLARPRVGFRLLALTSAVVGLHAVLLFWIPTGRYALLAWEMTLIAAAGHLCALATVAWSHLRTAGWAGTVTPIRRGAARPIVWAVVLAGGVLLEGASRLYDPMAVRRWGGRLLLPRRLAETLRNTANPKLDAVIATQRNSLGFRGPEPPRDFDQRLTILAIGDSTTAGALLSEGQDWPSGLGRRLESAFDRVWVGNAGFDSLSTFGQELLVDRMVSRLKPKLALFLLGSNDIGRERPTATDLALAAPSLLDVAASHSALVSEILARQQDRREGLAPGRELDLASMPHLHAARDRAQALIESHRRLFAPVYRQRVRRLVRACRRAGVEPVLMTQPALYAGIDDDATGVNLQWIEVDAARGIYGSLAWRILEKYNDVVREVGGDQGVPVIDLANELPQSSRLFYDFVHFTPEGARQVAEITARHVCTLLASRYPQHVTGSCAAGEPVARLGPGPSN
jgi:lysophospholipase L1-like esterase